MRYSVTVDGEANLRSMHAWLVNEPGVRRAEIAGSAPSPGEQGGLFDAIQVVLTDGMSLASLVVSIKQWRATVSPPPSVTVESPEGKRETVSGSSTDSEASG